MKYLFLFEGFNYQKLSDVRANCNEILFEFSDRNIKYELWGFEGVRKGDDIKDLIRIEIGLDSLNHIKLNEFESEFNHLLSYLESEGFVFSKESFVENDSWDPYLICPECKNTDIDDRNTIITCPSCYSTFDMSDFHSGQHPIENKSDFIYMISSKYWVQFMSLEFERIRR